MTHNYSKGIIQFRSKLHKLVFIYRCPPSAQAVFWQRRTNPFKETAWAYYMEETKHNHLTAAQKKGNSAVTCVHLFLSFFEQSFNKK